MRADAADILFIDFETTGSTENTDSIPWQLGAIRVLNGEICPEHAFSLFLKVPLNYPFNPYTPGRWALIRDTLAKAPDFTQLWPQLQPWLTQRAIAAHHAPTERTILKHAFPLATLGPWLDTLTLARCAYPYLPGHKLEDLIPALNLTQPLKTLAPNLAPHDAFYDACAAALLFQHIIRQPGWTTLTLRDIQHLVIPARH